MKKFKIGDKVHCHTNCIMQGTDNIAATAGKVYKIIGVSCEGTEDETFIINDNFDHIHHFNILKKKRHYTNWFYDTKKMRTEKIKKLNQWEV